MYDHIKFYTENFLTQEQTEIVINRFALYQVEERKKIFFHNKLNSGLKQCKGIYIKIEDGFIFFELSLHKFWNEINGKGLRNDNKFTFEDATKTVFELQKFLGFEILQSTVYFYEYGINIKAPKELDFFVNDLIGVKTNKMHEFTWVVYHKKFKVYSTERTKVIRTVFVIYDKTFETLEKGFLDVESNILRLEIKHKRIEKKIKLLDLFTTEQEDILKTNLKKIFIDNIIFKKDRPKNISLQDFLIYENLKFFGEDYTKNIYLSELKNGIISKRTFERRLNSINMIKNFYVNIKECEKESEKVFKSVVFSGLRHLWRNE